MPDTRKNYLAGLLQFMAFLCLAFNCLAIGLGIAEGRDFFTFTSAPVIIVVFAIIFMISLRIDNARMKYFRIALAIVFVIMEAYKCMIHYLVSEPIEMQIFAGNPLLIPIAHILIIATVLASLILRFKKKSPTKLTVILLVVYIIAGNSVRLLEMLELLGETYVDAFTLMLAFLANTLIVTAVVLSSLFDAKDKLTNPDPVFDQLVRLKKRLDKGRIAPDAYEEQRLALINWL